MHSLRTGLSEEGIAIDITSIVLQLQAVAGCFYPLIALESSMTVKILGNENRCIMGFYHGETRFLKGFFR